MSSEIRRAAGVLAPGGVIEVRALADGATHSGYFDDYEALAQAVEALDADPAVAGIYVTLNTVNPALLARRANRIKMRLGRKDATTADADILRRRWLPVDIDPVRPSGVSSTDAEHAAALDAAGRIAAYLTEQGFPEPLRADSGNGAHLLYRIDLANDDAATEVVKGVLTTLDTLFSNDVITVDTANYNAARIWKLYGTLSRKGDSTPERPHRRAKILSVPQNIEVVPRERLQHLAGILPKDEPAPRRTGGSIDLVRWLAEHGIAVRSTRPWQGGTLYVLAECPFSGAHKDGAFAIQFANGAVFAGCHHASCGGGAQRWPELRAMYEPREKRKQEAIAGAKVEENPTPPRPAPAPDEYRERAFAILQHGDPLTFLLDTFNKSHVGDRTVAECLAMSIASQSVENTKGLHVAISGNSGKGKSHACTTMQNLIPEAYKLTGTVSDKALYYDDDLRPGTVFLFDDTALSDDLQEVLKSATTSFHEPIIHRTITADRQLRVCSIPERCVWWLAKVENPGDDQVMNRMLTVWIDDSAEQDARVLEHLKRTEASGSTRGDDPDVLTCRALWSIVKEHRIFVHIPFARRIEFSNAANRRNPAMLFDLIKCHAALWFLQREGEETDGETRIEATRQDFDAAARLYGAINQEGGGQESKMTRNEAAALVTIARMGWETFTVRMLQQATGLSYHQVRRILQGYTAKGTTYCGLLEKCPAVSVVDATVIDESTGTVVRRHELHFQFDAERYREWVAQAVVWLEDEGEDDSPPPSGGSCNMRNPCCKGVRKHSCKEIGDGNSEQKGDGSGNEGVSREIDHGDQRSFAANSGSHSPPAPAPLEGHRDRVHERRVPCVSGPAANGTIEHDDLTMNRKNNDVSKIFHAKSVCAPICAPLCSTAANVANGVRPISGVLDPGTFARVKVELGRCDICDSGKAVYRSREAQVGICEGCYARLVREGNAREGVR
jgi:energy-coupling factor transporter ATP-binding protein EcfA2